MQAQVGCTQKSVLLKLDDSSDLKLRVKITSKGNRILLMESKWGLIKSSQTGYDPAPKVDIKL